ncbi:MAG: YggS family pyridoxal phosphate-dependent enzyme [Paludibacteraceae bacterium]|nr:YggS family pyridoxal phosphate-dependent enzyme [Paludibacteraceae bacterium]
MNNIKQNIRKTRCLLPQGVTMICVSKFHPVNALQEAYDCGERDFGESRVQELLLKYEALPKDIRWHFIGHLQTNKVKQILPFIHLIHSVDSIRLLEIINREAEKIQRRVKVLLEVHIAKEETKSGFTPEELNQFIIQIANFQNTFPWVEICGIMGMATNTDDEQEIRRCFREICAMAKQLSNHSGFLEHAELNISMGMSDDYLIAIEEGSTMVRIGSSIFGNRDY